MRQLVEQKPLEAKYCFDDTLTIYPKAPDPKRPKAYYPGVWDTITLNEKFHEEIGEPGFLNTLADSHPRYHQDGLDSRRPHWHLNFTGSITFMQLKNIALAIVK